MGAAVSREKHHGRSPQPLIAVLRDEIVVVQMRTGRVNAVDLLKLARTERFVLVEAPDAFEQALAAQDFVQTGDAAAETVRRVEERRVAVGDLDAEAQQFRCGVSVAAFLQQFDRALRPHGPMTEQTADNAAFFACKSIRREEIGHDVVVVAGVERDIITSGLDHGANDVDGLVAVERRDLDGDDVFDLREATPERVAQHASADAGLKIKAHDRQHLGHGAAVRDHVVLGSIAHRAEAEQTGMITERTQQFGLDGGLFRRAADAADAHERFRRAIHLFFGEFEHRTKQTDLRITNRELRRVNTDSEPAHSSGDVVTRERPLPPFIKFAPRIEREGMRGDGDAVLKLLAEIHGVLCFIEAAFPDSGNDESVALLHSRLRLNFPP